MANDTIRFITPVDIAPATTGSWQTVDMDTHITVDAEDVGVLIHIIRKSGATGNMGIRTGSSTDVTPVFGTAVDHVFLVAGMNASNEIGVYVGHADMEVWAFGMLGTNWEFLTNGSTFHPTSLLTWETKSLDGIFSDNNNRLAVMNINGASSKQCGIRHPSETFDQSDDFDCQRMAGVDGSDNVEIYRSSTNNNTMYIVGRANTSSTITLNVPATSILPSSSGTWETKTINADAVAAFGYNRSGGGTHGGSIAETGNRTSNHYDVEGQGAADDDYGTQSNSWIVACDTSGQVDVRVDDTSGEQFYWYAYATEAGADGQTSSSTQQIHNGIVTVEGAGLGGRLVT